MAKKTAKKRTGTRATSPGGGSREQQIQRLKDAVGAKGVKQAEEIVEEYEPDVIRLAFKLLGPARKVELSAYDKSMMEALGLTEDQWLKAKASRPK